jgi:hypothetical protein
MIWSYRLFLPKTKWFYQKLKSHLNVKPDNIFKHYLTILHQDLCSCRNFLNFSSLNINLMICGSSKIKTPSGLRNAIARFSPLFLVIFFSIKNTLPSLNWLQKVIIIIIYMCFTYFWAAYIVINLKSSFHFYCFTKLINFLLI